MKIDGGLGFDPAGIAEQAAHAEQSGYDGVWSAETSHDPFLPIAIAAAATEHLEFGTGITVAFARNPMGVEEVPSGDEIAAELEKFLRGEEQ